MEDLEKLWQKVLSLLELEIPKASFHTWFKESKIEKFQDGIVFLRVNSNFAKEWIENKYQKSILCYLKNFNDQIKSIKYVIKPALTIEKEANPKTKIKLAKAIVNEDLQPSLQKINLLPETKLNPRYKLSNFIVGPCNELAYAAALAVTEKPGRKYNPLFVYGRVGLGKTHLIQGIGNALLEKDKSKKIIYTTSEEFTNEVVNAIHYRTTLELRKKYRNVDLLIIDDIQFIGGKERTEEEFFHTFNALYENNKQIVISSDKPPFSLVGIEKRLKSRFEGGMIVDISQPDFETRIAILHQKMKENNIFLPEEVVEVIAKNISDNIRHLEGSLNLVYNNLKYKKIPPTKKNIEEILNSIFKPRKVIKPQEVINTICQYFNLETSKVVSQSRKKEFVHARQMIIYFLREELEMPYLSIGSILGNRDHTTIMYSLEKINKEIENNPLLEKEINEIKEILYQSE